jgi:RNA polymerase sigma factor (sigma-70 family)
MKSPRRREAGLAGLFLDYGSELRRHVANRLGCDEDVEDLVQDVFLKAHRALTSRSITHPRAYLHGIADSAVADHFRRRQRRCAPPRDMSSIDDEAEIPHTSPTPEELAIGEQTWEGLRVAMDRLPRQAKQAVMLRKLEQLSCSEVALSMGISVRTVEKHLARGLSDLRASVGH